MRASGVKGVVRTLGRYGPADRGATLVVVSGLHGNEPAGVIASQRVCRSLDSFERFRGRVWFVVGNVAATAAGVRYLDRDLNRAWTPRQIHALRNGSGAHSTEDVEQKELLDLIDSVIDEAPEEVFLLDLHTTSGPGASFSTVADTLANRRLALAYPVPVVLGLEELVEGTLHDYMGQRGITSVAFESGQHGEPEAVDRAEAAIWITLASTGVVRRDELPMLDAAFRTLARGHGHLPKAVEMRYRHPIVPGDGFRMRDGFRNFQPIRRGELLASDVDGEVCSPESARLLMPLYQAQGSDGFFVVREFRPIWLAVSRALRRARLDRVVHWLPGVRRHPDQPEALVVNRRVARWYALQVLHLLGFRRHLDLGDKLVVHRRVHDRQ